ncbi:MAG TPA: diacylglycerol kinase family protein [bacterium]|nr:diacylglycerol kinase family protein [bacterium]
MAGIGIIHNPFAKGNLKRPWIAKDIKALVEGVGVFRETRNINELPAVAEEFIAQGIDTIAVNGGDGTLHLVLSAFVNVYRGRPLPRVMSLRGGTMNTMSNSLKIKGNTMSILKQAVKKYKAGEPFVEKPQHLLKINDKYGFMSGAGIIANFLDAYYSGSSTGPWQAAKLVSKTIASALTGTEYAKNMFKASPWSVTVDGKALEPSEFTVILACTIRELGLGFAPTPRAYDKPGHFHFIASTIKPFKLVPLVPVIWLGRDLKHRDIQHTDAIKEAVVVPRGRQRWSVDGEMYDTNEPLHYSVGPTVTVVEP